jgi:hypothetical protein
MHGGKRENAGRKPGVLNKRTQAQRDRAITGGEMPLDYLLRTMRTSKDEAKRMEAAKAAAPYCHARQEAVRHMGSDGGAIEVKGTVIHRFEDVFGNSDPDKPK